jgi:hypothetical protein
MVFLGLGVPEWLTIIGLVGGLWLTFKMMARASVAYERARKAREQREQEEGLDETRHTS